MPDPDSRIIPNPHLTRSKLMECRGGCGSLIEVGVGTRNQPRCFTCGINAAVTTIVQMSNKSGPVYDRWRASMRNWLETELGVTGDRAGGGCDGG